YCVLGVGERADMGFGNRSNDPIRRNTTLHRHCGPLIHAPPSAECTAVVPLLEFFSIRPGPDGLSRITRRPERQGIAESWVVDSSAAEEAVLLRWARFHIEVLGFSAALAFGITRTLTE